MLMDGRMMANDEYNHVHQYPPDAANIAWATRKSCLIRRDVHRLVLQEQVGARIISSAP